MVKDQCLTLTLGNTPLKLLGILIYQATMTAQPELALQLYLLVASLTQVLLEYARATEAFELSRSELFSIPSISLSTPPHLHR